MGRLQEQKRNKKTREVKSNKMTNETRIEKLEEEGKLMIKIMDKLEQRISKLEKVLTSHAKCIGEIREKKHE